MEPDGDEAVPVADEQLAEHLQVAELAQLPAADVEVMLAEQGAVATTFQAGAVEARAWICRRLGSAYIFDNQPTSWTNSCWMYTVGW